MNEYVGLLAAFITVAIWAPQPVKSWRQRHDSAALAGVSLPMQLLSLAGGGLWLYYGVALQSPAIWITQVGILPMNVLMVVLLTRARARAAVPA